jgi:hypothetical protein
MNFLKKYADKGLLKLITNQSEEIDLLKLRIHNLKILMSTQFDELGDMRRTTINSEVDRILSLVLKYQKGSI